jgi:S-adenosylmethionine-diacylglycerol 3-amino-3-carboxypropyl transferase
MPTDSLTAAHPWALEAARLPLAFAQVREDPRLDVEVATALPQNATVVMIASGGETLVELARLKNIARVHAVDMNPAQIALSRLKCRLAGTSTPDESCRLLGHHPMQPEEREKELHAHLAALELPGDIFGHPSFIAEFGADHAGRYERCFAQLRDVLGPSAALLNDTKLEDALAKVMSLENLVALFGREATQNPERPFHQHFAQRTRVALLREDASVNPFVWQMYRGVFAPGHRYDWLQSAEPPLAAVQWHQDRMREVLDAMPACSADFIHLSNILDWLDAEAAAATLASARRVLKPKGRIIIRQLNSSLDFTALSEGLKWDTERGAAMERRDRSFFYPRIHLATRA